MSDGDRGSPLGVAETLVGAGGQRAPKHIDSAAATVAGESVSAVDATLRGLGLGGDHATLQPVDDRAYAIGDEIARGGMGKILSARDRRLHRDVVIKVGRDSAIDPRFEREALITARLQHPSIVRVYEAGVLGDGRAFYAMERVRGRGLDAVIAEAKVLRERLALLPHAIAVADAIAYAHSEQIVHRDLKPSNVLIGPFGETVVIDWGLAKDLRVAELDAQALPSAGASTSLTRVGAVMGTPSHMAPEQARGEAATERTDVYAIGAVIYQMLVGEAPYVGTGVDEVLQRVAAGVHVPLRQREPEIPPELAAIVERAMALAPKDRLTAQELADELRRYVSGQLVASHAYSLSTLVRRWLWRHRAAVGIGALALVVLAVLGGYSLREVAHERDLARKAAVDADVQRDRAERKADDAVIGHATALLDDDPSRAAALLVELSDRGIARPAAHAIAVDAAKAGLAWELRGHADDVEHLVVSHDGRHVATASDDATIRWWNLDADATSVILRGHTGPINDLIISDDDLHLASAGTDHRVYLWDTANGAARHLDGHTANVRGLAFSPDGTQLVSTDEAGGLWLWSVATGTGKLLAHHPRGLRAVAWGGDQIVAGGYDGMIGHFDPKTGKGEMKPAAKAEIRRLAIWGDYVASGDEDGLVILWTRDGTKVKELGGHTDVARDLVFTPDGKHLASCGGDNVVHVFSLPDGAVVDLLGNRTGVKDIDISADGKLVASAGLDGIARVWKLTGGKPRELRGHGYPVKHVAFSPDGRLVSGSEDDRARVWTLTPPPPPPQGTALRAWVAAHTNVQATTR